MRQKLVLPLAGLLLLACIGFYATSDGKLEDPPIKHEYCIVFRKPAGEQLQAPLLAERCLKAPEVHQNGNS